MAAYPSPNRRNPQHMPRRSLLRAGLALSPALALPAWLRAGGRMAQAAAPAAPLSQSTPACIITPEETIRPYFVDEDLNRSDIRSDPTTGAVKDGAPLTLTLQLSQAGQSCGPLTGAVVDLWQCDALGVYSDVSDPGFSTTGQKFLRGSQVTDANGAVTFTTIYPGWYQGRAVHIHFMVRTDPSAQTGYQFTSQLYFDDGLTDQVHAQMPYAAKGQRTTRNADDGIFQQGGDQLLLDVTPNGGGYAAAKAIGVDFSATQPAGPGGPPPR
jgi:protocatechuate 3,4-dioxygenase beta subunit